MKKRFIPILVLIPLFLMGCSLLTAKNANQPMTDAEMATRVAELLSTMTTPTTEIEFPPTATMGLPTTASTATPEVISLASATPTVTVEVGGLPTETTVVLLPTLQATPTLSITALPSPTATTNVPSTDPINKLGEAASTDNMDSNAKWAWPLGSSDFTSVEFKDGYLMMTNVSKDAAGWVLPLLAQQQNSYIELTANSGTCTGKDSYGIIFRVPVLKNPDQGYLYQVTCDGYYRLWKWDGKSGTDGLAVSLLAWKQSDAINAGADKTNRLGVMTVDNKITLFMNGVQLGSVTDSSYSAGFFGAFVRTQAGSATNYTAKFDSMRYWENPAQ